MKANKSKSQRCVFSSQIFFTWGPCVQIKSICTLLDSNIKGKLFKQLGQPSRSFPNDLLRLNHMVKLMFSTEKCPQKQQRCPRHMDGGLSLLFSVSNSKVLVAFLFLFPPPPYPFACLGTQQQCRKSDKRITPSASFVLKWYSQWALLKPPTGHNWSDFFFFNRLGLKTPRETWRFALIVSKLLISCHLNFFFFLQWFVPKWWAKNWWGTDLSEQCATLSSKWRYASWPRGAWHTGKHISCQHLDKRIAFGSNFWNMANFAMYLSFK